MMNTMTPGDIDGYPQRIIINSIVHGEVYFIGAAGDIVYGYVPAAAIRQTACL